MEDAVGTKLKERMVKSQTDAQERRGEALRAVDKIYNNPREAYKIMQKYLADTSEKAFLSKLEKDPTYFGGMKGYPGSGKSLSLEGFKDRAVVKEVLPTLTPLIRATMAAEKVYLDQEKAYFSGRSGALSGPERGGGPDLG